jgi:hypothetical protein
MPQPPIKNLTGPAYSPWAGFLSYLVPGLGQIVQGRIGKGLLFLICLYSLFFYGMYLGSWSNVYLPDMADEPNTLKLPRPLFNLYNRLQFAGQFWIGVAAWPAIWQYNTFDPAKVEDAEPAREDGAARKTTWWSALATFQRAPYENRATGGGRRRNEAPQDWPGKTLNELQTEGDKTWDLAWVFTVIAGVLNVLVIYDACAGPAFGENEAKRESESQLQEASA